MNIKNLDDSIKSEILKKKITNLQQLYYNHQIDLVVVTSKKDNISISQIESQMKSIEDTYNILISELNKLKNKESKEGEENGNIQSNV